jgi:hypothetical protein
LPFFDLADAVITVRSLIRRALDHPPLGHTSAAPPMTVRFPPHPIKEPLAVSNYVNTRRLNRPALAAEVRYRYEQHDSASIRDLVRRLHCSRESSGTS